MSATRTYRGADNQHSAPLVTYRNTGTEAISETFHDGSDPDGGYAIKVSQIGIGLSDTTSSGMSDLTGTFTLTDGSTSYTVPLFSAQSMDGLDGILIQLDPPVIVPADESVTISWDGSGVSGETWALSVEYEIQA